MYKVDNCLSDTSWRSVCCKLNDRWLLFHFAEDLDVIYWWMTHDGPDDVLLGCDFTTEITYKFDNGTKEKFQVGYSRIFQGRPNRVYDAS
jgi:hypothetical protein